MGDLVRNGRDARRARHDDCVGIFESKNDGGADESGLLAFWRAKAPPVRSSWGVICGATARDGFCSWFQQRGGGAPR